MLDKILLFPYYLTLKLRDRRYSRTGAKLKYAEKPTLGVGNVTVGGTGKTPHVEMILRLLQESPEWGDRQLAVLSRGYKRESTGFQQVVATGGAATFGDEPLQIKKKFPGAVVAVDKNRVEGIRRLTYNDEDLDVVLLDDAFQHRYVKPGVNILLVDYHRLIIYDKLLPAGRLREPLSGKNRADIVIVTKCPKNLKPMEFRVITKAMDLFPSQHLYFTTLDYDQPYSVFGGQSLQLDSHSPMNVLLLTGIASPRQLQEDVVALLPKDSSIHPLSFSDHHHFSSKDVKRINSMFDNMPSPRIIITTEKDAARLTTTDGLSDEVKAHLYSLPVHIRFMQQEQENMFHENIVGYVLKNSRNSILAKSMEGIAEKKNTNKPHAGKPRTISFK